MKTEHNPLHITMTPLFTFAAIYAWATYNNTNPSFGRPDQVEWIGTVALTFGGFLCGMIWLVFLVISRRIDPRPEDRPDGEISDTSGEVGFFSPGSYWPIGLAAAAVFAGVGVAFWMAWLMFAGAIALIIVSAGLVFEYYTGTRKLGPE